MNLRFYFSIFLRRLPYFLIVATVISAAAITAAMTLPPAYESRAQIIVESPQIPEELAQSTVRTPPIEQLQIMEQKLLVRANLLDIARKHDVLPNMDEMNADEIVGAMRARTTIVQPRGRNPVPLMTIIFEAPAPRTAAAVVNDYLTLIQQEDVEFRRGRAGETLEFFEQEVETLSRELDEQSARILSYKQANAGALPDGQDFRMGQLEVLQQRVNQIGRDITSLSDQRKRLIQVFEQTGEFRQAGQVTDTPLSPEEQRLAGLEAELQEALVIYAPGNPRIVLLESRIAQLQEAILAKSRPADTPQDPGAAAPITPEEAFLAAQLDEIDDRITSLTAERDTTETRITALTQSIERSPEVSIALEELERRYASIEGQYNAAEDRLSAARTGEVIETRSRGQRISVIEQPAVPSQPTKPNRILIAGGGVAFGIFAGLGLVLLLELLNNTARRPEDIVARFDITPFTTIPYIRTRSQTFWQRSFKLLVILAILTGIPAAVLALHTYYLPFDLLADRVMDKIGIRW